MDDASTAPAAPATGDQPPAAVVVAKSPRELELEGLLETAEARRLEAERVAAENEDKAQQLIEIDRRRPAPTVKKKKPGATFFHEEEEDD